MVLNFSNFQAKYINMLMLYNLYQSKPDQAFNYLTHFKKQILGFCKTLNNITFISGKGQTDNIPKNIDKYIFPL